MSMTGEQPPIDDSTGRRPKVDSDSPSWRCFCWASSMFHPLVLDVFDFDGHGVLGESMRRSVRRCCSVCRCSTSTCSSPGALLIALLAFVVERASRHPGQQAECAAGKRDRMSDEEAVLPAGLIVVTSLGYVSILFAIAYFGDRRASQGRTLIANPIIYALSIAVYCTAWTFYGSVGRAVEMGLGFLPIYIGPTLMFALGWVVWRKMIRIGKQHRITSIADLISSRYGKSHVLGGLVTVIAVIGIMPYISLQLKAVATGFDVLVHYPNLTPTPECPNSVARGYGVMGCGSDGRLFDPFRHPAH